MRGLKLVYFLSIILVVYGIYMIFQSGIHPRAVKIIKPSYANDAAEAGETIFKVMYPRLARYPFFVWGKPLNQVESDAVLESFLKHYQSAEQKLDIVVAYSATVKLGIKIDGLEVSEVSGPIENLIAECKKQLEASKRFVVVLNSIEAAHFRGETIVKQLEAALKVSTASLINLPVFKDVKAEELDLIEKCDVGTDRVEFRHTLGCLQRSQGEKLRASQKTKWEKFVLVTEQEGERDYIIYTFNPTSRVP